MLFDGRSGARLLPMSMDHLRRSSGAVGLWAFAKSWGPTLYLRFPKAPDVSAIALLIWDPNG